MNLALPPSNCKVPTPEDLAAAMVRALGDKADASWLEPSHGTGVFLQALSQIGVPKNRLLAIDLDPVSSPADELAQTLRRTDFLKWAQTAKLRFDRIIGNPPYVSIKRLPKSLSRTAARVNDFEGNPIGSGANVWYAFVISSIRLLSEDGSLAFVLPSASEFAHYATEVRGALKSSFASLEIYRCKKSLFDNVQEGTVVAIARGYKRQPFVYRRREFENRTSLIAALLNNKKLRGKPCPANCNSVSSGVTTLASIAKIRLGGVTGDAGYFLMNEERRKTLGLPIQSMKPVVTKAKQLKSAAISRAQWNELKESGERVWLFRPREGDRFGKEVREYLELESDFGGCNKEAFKISVRDPWYTVPLPEKPHGFISGMAKAGPWISFNEMKGLNATNTLYVVTFFDQYLEDRYKWALAMFTSISQQQIRRIGRRYADGLIKYEPGLLAKIVLPPMKSFSIYRDLYHEAVEALLKGNLKMVKKIADANVAQNTGAEI